MFSRGLLVQVGVTYRSSSCYTGAGSSLKKFKAPLVSPLWPPHYFDGMDFHPRAAVLSHVPDLGVCCSPSFWTL